jgi:hypothetical protein
MKKQIYLCVDLKAVTEETCFEPQESRTGLLTMLDEDHFLFYEAARKSNKRNPRLWSGKTLNISKKPDGSLSVNFKPMILDDDASMLKVAGSIYRDLMAAKRDLLV